MTRNIHSPNASRLFYHFSTYKTRQRINSDSGKQEFRHNDIVFRAMNPANPNNRLPDALKKLCNEQRKPEKGSKDKSKQKIAGVTVLSCGNTAASAIGNEPDDTDNRITIIDSGASRHMFGSRPFMANIREAPSVETIDTADGSKARIEGVGGVALSINPSVELSLSNVLYAPSLHFNLISVAVLASKGILVSFQGDKCILSKGKVEIGVIDKDNRTGLYVVPPYYFQQHIAATTLYEKWHNRSGHIGKQRVFDLHKHVDDVPKLSTSHAPLCEPCEKGKAHMQPYTGSMERAKKPGEIVYSDVAGPYAIGRGGERYFITFLDDYSRYLWVMTTRTKKVSDYFQTFLNEVHSHFNTSVLRIHTDKGKEYSTLENLFDCVNLTTTTGYNPQHNPLAERVNRSLKDPARAILIAADLPQSFWPDAIEHVARLYNQLPHSTLGMSPFEQLFGKRPSAKYWRVFGCKCYVFVPKEKRKGFDSKATSGILLACLPHGLYRVYTEHGDVVESKHVRADECIYPGKQFLRENGLLEDSGSDLDFDSSSEWEEGTSGSTESQDTSASFVDVGTFDEDISTESSDCIEECLQEPDQNSPEYQNTQGDEVQVGSGNEADVDAVTYYPEHHSSFRETSDDDEYFTPKKHPGTTERPRRDRKLPERYTPNACVAKVNITTSDKPTLNEAMNASEEEKSHWNAAIEAELESLEKKGTWTMQDEYPSSGTVLPSFLVLQVKRKADGSIERFKARLVANGNRQSEKSYTKSHTPVLDFSSSLTACFHLQLFELNEI